MDNVATIYDAARRIQDGSLQPLDVVEACLDRIERFEDRVHAWVLVDANGARETAARLGQEAADGKFRGPLHGIPLGIKDIVDVAGWPTRAGSTVTPAEPAKRDALLVWLLREAGAIFLGKTVTTEFACFDPAPTRNPWNVDHTPGGSSSGSAAAVALGMCLGAIGSQTGGSITRPASYCGICGMKPTIGRVITKGIVPVSFHLDHPGPMARCVTDLAILLDALVDDPRNDPFGRLEPVDRYVAAVGSPALPRLGVLEEFFMTEADDEVRRITHNALETLRRAGAEVEICRLPDGFDDIHHMHRTIMAVDAAEFHRSSYPGRQPEYGPQLRALLEEGQDTSALDYSAALHHQRKFQLEWIRAFVGRHILVSPATPTTAPAGLESTGDPRFNSPFSYAGLPTVSLPCGLANNGMPCSLQLIGQSMREDRLLSAAAWCERQLDFRAVPPMLSEETDG